MARARSVRPRRVPLNHVCLADDGGVDERRAARALTRLLSRGLSRFEGVGERRAFWPNGSTIRIGFVDPAPSRALVDKVKEIAPQWTKYAQLEFEFVRTVSTADITISFLQRDTYSSLIGIDSRQGRPSMHLGFPPTMQDEAAFQSLILHEFGHALGLHHEHQNPQGNPVQWDAPKVYAYFRQHYGWPEDKTFANVIRRLEHDASRFLMSDFDPRSIMLYAFPKELTTNGVGTERASELSETDIALIRQIYPGRAAPVTVRALVVDGPAADGDLKRDSVDDYEMRIEEEAGYVVETTGTTDTLIGLFGPDDPTRLVREEDNLGEGANARVVEWLRPGRYRVTVRAGTFRPGVEGPYRITAKRFHRASS